MRNSKTRKPSARTRTVPAPSPAHAAGASSTLRARWRQHHVALPVVGGLLLLAVTLVYGQTVGHQFVNYDDPGYVYRNPHVLNGLTAGGLTWAFTHFHACNWHPLTWISHQVDCQIYGPWAGGHHLTNVLLHALTAILLLLVLLRMTGELWPAAMTAALFAVHPLRVESVAWVAERKDLLSGMFFMLTLYAYTTYATRPFAWGRYLTVVLLFALGLMAKPILVTLPAVLLLLDYWPLGRLPATRLVLEKIPLVLLSAASCVVTLWAQIDAMQAMKLTFLARLGNALVAYVAYMGQFIWPGRLALLYIHPGGALPIAKILGSVVVLVGITAAAWAWRRTRPYLIVGWLWYLIMLLPVIGLVQVGVQAMADRYTYLPQIGVIVALVWTATELGRKGLVGREILAFGSVAWLVGLMAVAFQQAGFWHDSESLWRRTLDCTANNYVAHGQLAQAFADLGRRGDAVVEFRKSLDIRPDWPLTHFDLGTNLGHLGRDQEAIACYREALRLQPDYLDAQNNLANALRRAGRYEEAAIYYAKAMREGPDGAPGYNNYGGMLLSQGKIDQAVACFQQAIQRDPDYATAHNNLGNAFMRLRRTADAIACYRTALALQPDFAEPRASLTRAVSGQPSPPYDPRR